MAEWPHLSVDIRLDVMSRWHSLGSWRDIHPGVYHSMFGPKPSVCLRRMDPMTTVGGWVIAAKAARHILLPTLIELRASAFIRHLSAFHILWHSIGSLGSIDLSCRRVLASLTNYMYYRSKVRRPLSIAVWLRALNFFRTAAMLAFNGLIGCLHFAITRQQ
eukprot:scaffold74747_cov34-Prasinocladus_malaysianus.AAC.1